MMSPLRRSVRLPVAADVFDQQAASDLQFLRWLGGQFGKHHQAEAIGRLLGRLAARG